MVKTLNEDLKRLKVENDEFQQMLKQAEQVKIDLLEQMEEYQEEVNSHKQA